MWQDLDGLGGAGVNSSAHQVDQFSTTELTPEQQKILIDIRRKKTELLLEIQVSQLHYFFPLSYSSFTRNREMVTLTLLVIVILQGR